MVKLATKQSGTHLHKKPQHHILSMSRLFEAHTHAVYKQQLLAFEAHTHTVHKQHCLLCLRLSLIVLLPQCDVFGSASQFELRGLVGRASSSSRSV